MDIRKIVEELRIELEQVDAAIASIELLAVTRVRRGRPASSVTSARLQKRKNVPAVENNEESAGDRSDTAMST
jgi:hypothetical protein